MSGVLRSALQLVAARLDGANALALGALLADFARTSGTTVICATHDPLLIEQADVQLSLGSR